MDLLFTIEPGEETWIIIGPTPDSPPHVVASPLADLDFIRLVDDLRHESSVKLPPEKKNEIRSLKEIARRISDRLTPLLLSEDARKAVSTRLNEVQNGRARITLRVEDRGILGDQALALPWEVVAPDEPGKFPVEESRLEIVREAVIPGAHELPEPSGPLTVAVAVAAPEGEAALSYEKEEVRLQTHLAPLGHAVVFSDLGTLDDLVELVRDQNATAILFSGHGLPGQLLFEDKLGFGEPIGVEEVMRRLRTVLLDPGRGGSFPNVFFLSSCDGATGAKQRDGQGPSSLLGNGPSTAATLHRAGFPQVIGYFGGVRDSAAARAEEAFFRELARGANALQAAHVARASLVDVFEHEGRSFQFPLAWTQLAIYYRGVDRAMADGGRKPGRSLPPHFRRRTDDQRGLPVLTQGFIGRRGLQHDVLRRIHQGERLIVLHGLAGSGKTALAGHLMTRRLGLSPDPAGALLLRVSSPDETPEPLLELRLRAEEHGQRHAIAGWAERIAELRERFPAPAAGFAATVRALQAARPPLTLCVDGVDALQVGPGTGVEPGLWRPGGAEWWREIEKLASDGILVLATTRYANADLPFQSHVGVPPLSPSDAFRMMAFFVELAALAPDQRRRLAAWSDGHPYTIRVLDEAIRDQVKSHGLGWEATDSWKELVEPALSRVAEAGRREMRLDALWADLPETAREHARRIGASRNPLPLQEVDRLGEERGLLIRSGLLVRYRQQMKASGSFRWADRWGLPLRLREMIANETGHE